ncbi:hypothetical protein GS597_01135 [Synechococcales cyanobacterium C]|uniref:Uncharacterized protein n=1 Tax=Petrachloros mirabilis ULC683 TaxID=2781853 RepID=A0A8K1ZW00_9CYAN|nr:hypothetical protein [Petrachloros mirabilis]NCJ05143.1 hypothetical protein [Petrachloros mirabilis ULC683]
MSTRKRLIPSALASLLILGSGLSLGIDAASAQFRQGLNRDPGWGSRCDLRGNRYDCGSINQRDSRWDWFESNRDWRTDRRGFPEGRVASGTLIPVSTTNRDRIVLRRNERLPLRVFVDRDIRANDTRQVVIPRDSIIEGELRPRSGGTVFEANTLYLRNGGEYRIRGRSETILPSRDQFARFPDRRPSSNIGGVLLSDAARVLLSSVLGGRSTFDPGLLGGLFDLRGNSRRPHDDGRFDPRLREDLVVISPQRDLDVRLTSELRIRR